MPTDISIRPAEFQDIQAITQIYNQGIEDRIATFETQLRTPGDIQSWLNDPAYPLLVAIRDHTILGWVRASSYRPRDCYKGIAEFSIYIARNTRKQGVGSLLMPAFFDACTEQGFWKILSRIFPENTASLNLCKHFGFKEVGIYEKHAKLDGVWKDVIIVEKLLEQNL